MIVMKFGGTSTQDAAAIANVARIVQSRLSAKPIVIISAIAQATNTFERAGNYAANGDEEAALHEIHVLIDRHRTIIGSLIQNLQRQKGLSDIFASSYSEIERLLKGISILRELTPRTLDALYCYGEVLSSRMVSEALNEIGVQSRWLDTKDFMITDDHFNNAIPMFDAVEERLKPIVFPLIDKGIVPVTQGFIGATATGRRTTMGRESSDYSAAIIGSVLDAEDIQIWTDVDGVLTADPRVVSSPKKVKVLSFEEAFELSFFGAKVLHPNTMLPAIEKNIPIHIYNSRRPNLSGTLVTGQNQTDHPVVKSVASKRNVILLSITPKKRYGQYIFWEHLHNILTKYEAVAGLTVTSEYNYSIVLEAKSNFSAVVHEMSEIGLVRVLEGQGIVCVVGANLQQSPELIYRIFKVVSDLRVSMISYGASKSNLSFIIDDGAIPEAVRRIHQEFFESQKSNDLFEILDHFEK